MNKKSSILIIYTGGTIGMVNNPETGALEPFKFDQIVEQVPELKRFGYTLDSYTFDPPIDSSDIEIPLWKQLAELVHENYEKYDGFVILHGTDTMSYTASAMSFMLQNQYKPVIFTGSQLPIGMIRTDGKENLITAIEIAAAKRNKLPLVPEVCIYFENMLYRANRTTKHHAAYFNAFRSYNYPALAEAGVHIKYNHKAIHYPDSDKKLAINTQLDDNVAILKLFPGINQNVVESILSSPNLKGIVLETFGSGNATSKKWFIDTLKKAVNSGIYIINVTQCKAGSVEMGRYSTSMELKKAQILSGADITTESAITKLMYVLGLKRSREETRRLMEMPIAGEMTVEK